MAPHVDYYAVLEVDPNATQQQIKDAYKKAALKHHPDRVPADSPERAARTKRFQQINDAYYTLSDPVRRRDYDDAHRFQSSSYASSSTAAESEDEEIPHTNTSTPGGFPWSSFFRRGASAKSQTEEQFSDEQFGSVFEEMMQEEGMAEGERATPTTKFWAIVGGLSGAALGFIVGNFPGAVGGMVAGNRLGAIRDHKGKSVYSVFQELDQSDKAKVLSELAAKVFAHAVSA